MPLDIPLPTALPEDDPSQYIPLLLSAIEGFLQVPDVWAAVDFDEAYRFMEQLKVYLIMSMTGGFLEKIPGLLAMFGGATPPDGWLLCDGDDVLKADYPDLFQEIGNAFSGGADLGTVFRLPNLTNRSPRGAGSEIDLGEVGGNETVTLELDNVPAHNHEVRRGAGTAGTGSLRPTFPLFPSLASVPFYTDASGSGVPFSIIPPVQGINFIICTGN